MMLIMFYQLWRIVLVLLFSGIPVCTTGSSHGPIVTFLVVWLFQSASTLFSNCFLIDGFVFVLAIINFSMNS